MTGARLAVCLLIGVIPAVTEHPTRVSKASDHEILVQRSFDAPLQKVYDALTRQDQVLRWFQPAQMALAAYHPDVRNGGTSRYVFRRPNGRSIEMRQSYHAVDPPRRLVYTESYDFSPLELSVTTLLADADGETVLTQTIRYPSPKDRDGDFENVASAATAIYVSLDRFLAAPR